MIAIIDWYNCLNSHPVTCLEDFTDGKHFLEIVQKIKVPKAGKEKGHDVLSIDDTYRIIEKTIDDVFNTKSSNVIMFDGCKLGSKPDLAKVAIVLLSGLVKARLQENLDLSAMYNLDQDIQKEIKKFMSCVLQGDLLLDFEYASPSKEQIRSSPADCVSEFKTPKLPSKTSRANFIADQYIETPPRSNFLQNRFALSPLKKFFDSPQVQHQLALDRCRLQITELLSSLTTERNRADDLQQDLHELQEKLDTKVVELQQAKDKIIELRHYHTLSDELTAYREQVEAAREKFEKEKSNCENCKMLQSMVANLKEEVTNFDKYYLEKEQLCDRFNDKLVALQQSNEELESALVASTDKCEANEATIIQNSHSLSIKDKNIASLELKCVELEKELEYLLQTSPRSVPGETMDIVTNQIHIDELEKILEGKNNFIEELTSQLADVRGQYQELDSEMKSRCEEFYACKTTLSAQNEDLESKLNSLSENMEQKARGYLMSLKAKDDEAVQLTNNIKVLDDTIHSLKAQILTLQNDHKEVQREMASEKEKNNQVSKEKLELELQMKIHVERLNETIKEKKIQIEENEKDRIHLMAEWGKSKQQISSLEVTKEILTSQISEMSSQIESLSTKINELNNQIQTLAVAKEEAEKEYLNQIQLKEDALHELKEKTKNDYQHLMSKWDESKHQVACLEMEKNSLTSQIEGLNSQVERFNTQIVELNIQKESLSAAKEEAEREYLNQIQLKEKIIDELKENNKIDRVHLMGEWDKSKQQIISLEMEKNNLTSQIEEWNNQVERLHAQINELNSQIGSLCAAKDQADKDYLIQMKLKDDVIFELKEKNKNDHLHFVGELNNLRMQIAGFVADLESSISQNQKLKSHVDTLNAQINELNHQLDALSTEKVEAEKGYMNQIQLKEDAIKSLEERLNNEHLRFVCELDKSKQQISQLESDLKCSISQNHKLNSQVDSLSERNSDFNIQVNSLISSKVETEKHYLNQIKLKEYSISELEEKYKKDHLHIMSEWNNTKQQLSQLEADLECSVSQNQELNIQVGNLSTEISELNIQLALIHAIKDQAEREYQNQIQLKVDTIAKLEENNKHDHLHLMSEWDKSKQEIHFLVEEKNTLLYQIDELNSHNDKLSANVNDLNRQLNSLSASMAEADKNYLNQIQLKEDAFIELEEKTKNDYLQLTSECDKLKLKIVCLEADFGSSVSQNQILESHVETLSNQINELNHQLDSLSMAKAEADKNYLNQIQLKDDTIIELEEKTKNYHCQFMEQLDTSKHQVTSLELERASLISQNEELKSQVTSHSAKISNLNNEFDLLTEAKEHSEKEYLTEIQLKEDSIKDLEEKIKNDNLHHMDELSKSKQQTVQLEADLKSLVSQNQKLNVHLETLNAQIKDLNQQLGSLSMSMAEAKKDYLNQIQLKEDTIKSLEERHSNQHLQLVGEWDISKQQIAQLQSELESSVSQNLELNSQMGSLSTAKVKAEKDYQNQIKLKEDTIRELEERYKNDNLHLMSEWDKTKQQLSQLESDLECSVTQNREINIQVGNLSTEISELNTQLGSIHEAKEEAKKEYLSQIQLKEDFINELKERNKKDNLHLMSDLDKTKQKITYLEEEKARLMSQNHHLNSQLESLSVAKEQAEKDRLTEIQLKEDTITNLKEQMQLIESKSVVDNAEIEVLHSRYEEMKSKCSLEIEKTVELEIKMESLASNEQKIHSLEVENEKLKVLAKEATAQSNKCKNERKEFIARYAKESVEKESDLQKLQQKYAKLKEMFDNSEKEKMNCRKQVSKLSDLLKSHQDKAAMGKSEKEALYEELAQSKSCIEETRTELLETKESLTCLEGKVKELEHARMVKIKEIQALRASLKSSEEESQRLKRATRALKTESVEHDIPRLSSFRPTTHDTSLLSSTLIEKTDLNQSEFRLPHSKALPHETNCGKKDYMKPSRQSLGFQQWSPLSVSTISSRFDKSLLAGSQIVCDEEDFFNHTSLTALQPPSTGKRLNELKRRNTLVPNHLKSSYPVETQFQPLTKFNDTVIKQGSPMLKKTSSDPLATPSKRKSFFNYLSASAKKLKGNKENDGQQDKLKKMREKPLKPSIRIDFSPCKAKRDPTKKHPEAKR